MNEYDKIYSYTSYPKAGSTSSISYRINSGEYDEQRNEVESKRVSLINLVLKELKGKKHWQRKIPSILIACEMWQGSDKEIFVISDHTLINLTSRIEYDLSQDQVNSLAELLN